MTLVDVIDYGQPLREDHVPVPMTYAQIADDIAARIKAGEYPPGSKLPSYRELGELYSVHQTTAAKAIALLRRDGLVVGAPGRGTYVAEVLP